MIDDVTLFYKKLRKYMVELQYGASHFLTDQERSLYMRFAIIYITKNDDVNIEKFTYDFKEKMWQGCFDDFLKDI